MGVFVEAFKLAIEKPLHGLVLCLCGGIVWLGSVVVLVVQPALAEQAHHMKSAEMAIANDHTSLSNVATEVRTNSVQLARMEGMLKILIERTDDKI